MLLIVLNLLGAISFYYAVPVYEAMKHINPGWMTRDIRTTLSVINVFAALLVFKRFFYIGLAALFVTGSFAYMHAVHIRNHYAVSLLFSYWDVTGLLALAMLKKWQTKHAQRKPS